MPEITQMFQALERGDARSTEELIPLVYEDLRRLAAYRLAQESPGQTLQATALVHEAYLRLVKQGEFSWQNRAYFFSAAAEAMRRIVIGNARYCDTQRLPLTERLRLFQHVCAAVKHAHQKGIIHRDLKPSNIVIIDPEGQPVPKIIDFGIAKSLHGRLTNRTLVTQREMILGTPAYMSPEQVTLASEDLDTRTDIYSRVPCSRPMDPSLPPRALLMGSYCGIPPPEQLWGPFPGVARRCSFLRTELIC